MHVRIWILALTLVAVFPLLGCDAAKPICADDRPEPPALAACADLFVGPAEVAAWRR